MRRPGFFLLALFAALSTHAQTDDLLRRAEKLQRDKPTPARAVGLLELRRAAGQKLDLPRSAGDLPKPPARDAAVEVIAWRALPITPADRPAFEAFLTVAVKAGVKSPWLPVLRLYAASVANDRAALIAAAATVTDVPTAFPGVAAEQAHFELLKELGLDENTAGLDVIAHRPTAPMHALLDLDRALTRDVEFLQGTSRAADAKALQTCRDRLRQAWLDASRHLVERLFALHVLGRTQDADGVLFAARELPYLTDPAEFRRALARLDRAQAWSLLIQPLLSSEMSVIANPPRLPAAAVAAAAASQLTVEARAKSVQTGIASYEGAVRLRAGTVEIACDKLAVVGDVASRVFSGAGNVAIKGAGGFDVLADAFTFTPDAGTYTLTGNVRLTRDGRTTKLRAATIGRAGDLRDAVSLLDDFDAANDSAARLGLLPRITNAYTDDELPPAVRYLLAMSLLRPYLSWQPSDTPLDLPLEPFLREDASAGTRAGGAVEAMLQKDAPLRVAVTVRSANHADIRRAKALLSSITEGDLAPRAAAWLERL